ncbi:hypothetical protein [Streptomyces sp. NPDC051909]|uniref:hypothetical protein n=1 Tax=Streptomyces sp. NPDC051909 TaxID=3154944 RepID=UPI00344A3CCA
MPATRRRGQEVFALLATYQILRLAMADATGIRPDIDPDRASFHPAEHCPRPARPGHGRLRRHSHLVGAIGPPDSGRPMPDRRIRTRPRVVKRAISKYNARGTVDRTSYKATISIDGLTTRTP